MRAARGGGTGSEMFAHQTLAKRLAAAPGRFSQDGSDAQPNAPAVVHPARALNQPATRPLGRHHLADTCRAAADLGHDHFPSGRTKPPV